MDNEGAVIVEISDLREIIGLADHAYMKQQKGRGGREMARVADLLDDIVNGGIKYGPVSSAGPRGQLQTLAR